MKLRRNSQDILSWIHADNFKPRIQDPKQIVGCPKVRLEAKWELRMQQPILHSL